MILYAGCEWASLMGIVRTTIASVLYQMAGKELLVLCRDSTIEFFAGP